MKNTLNYLNEILKDNDKIVVGVSGGPDSMCLLSLLIKIRKLKNIAIIVAHVHHNIRKESDEEAEFVQKYCQEHSLYFEMYKIENYNHDNFHEYARKERYNFFEQIIKKYKANYLFTAHHGDDLIETILMRLTRGSNLKGYAGFSKLINYPNYTLVRPLITLSKEEIEKYLQEENIEYRIDKSNFKEKYTRNRYRLHVLPFLKQENKNVEQKFLKFSEEINLIDEYLVENTKDALTKVMLFDKVNVHEFNKLHALIKRRVIEYILKREYGNNINKINDHHVSLIIKLFNSNKPNLKISLPEHKELIKSYNEIYFKKDSCEHLEERVLDEEVILNEKEKITRITSTSLEKSNYLLRLNSKEIALPLKVRFKKDKDKIALKNFNGTKKIKDIFINEKIPLEKRKTWPIVVDNNDTILWLPGLKKSKFDKNNNEFYDIIYKYVKSEEIKDEKK